jgi:hypothetical protein
MIAQQPLDYHTKTLALDRKLSVTSTGLRQHTQQSDVSRRHLNFSRFMLRFGAIALASSSSQALGCWRWTSRFVVAEPRNTNIGLAADNYISWHGIIPCI